MSRVLFGLGVLLLLSPQAAAQGGAVPAAAAAPKRGGKDKEKKPTPAPAAAKTAPEAGGTAPTLRPLEPAAAGPGPSEKAVPDPEKRDIGPTVEEGYLFQGAGSSPDEEREFKEFSEAIRAYDVQSREFRKEVQLLVEKKYEEKRASLAASYEKAIRDIEVLERKDRLDAIAMLEEFLERYCPMDRPEVCVDAKYVPDVIYRLAELYYEQTQDESGRAMREYEEALKQVQAGKLAAAPPEPQVSYQKAIQQYQRLITQFPKYRLLDGAYYLLAYCLEKQGEFDQSRDTYSRLIEKFPMSKFVPEAWVRMGEYYFDAVNVDRALDKAANAYTMAVRFKEHPLFDKALYKLGWTYYRMDRFEPAVDAFVRLIDYYEKKSKEAGDETAGGDLRTEALQYTAISLADEKWGSLAKAEELFRKIGPRPYESELYKRLGDVYYDQTKYKDAIAAYKIVLARDPLTQQAPLIQDKIVKACETGLRDFDCANRERQLFADLFGPGSAWESKNKRDTDAIKGARDLIEKSLYSAAVFHHQQALAHKQGQKYDLALREFQVAAQGYGEYLKRFPHSKQAYELAFYYAECLYNSFQFLTAAAAYEGVRDSPLDNRYQMDAAYAAVLSYQREAERLERDGRLQKLKVITNKDRPEGQKIVESPIPEVWKKFVAAADRFLKLNPTHDKSASIAYKAAELYYVHNQFDEARQRFKKVIAAYPGTEAEKGATNLTLETMLAEQCWKCVEDYTNVLTGGAKPIIDPKSETGRIWRDFGDSAVFKQAEALMADRKWDDAAKMYLELVRRNPSYKFADKGLNNAAVAYENARRFESALGVYERIYNEYPKSELADTALFRVAYNSEQSYDFDKAVDRYKLLIDKYATSKNREAAVNNAARLLDALQRYREAALMNERYADLFPNTEEAPKAQYRAAVILDKMGDSPGEIKALDEFIRTFSKDPKQAELIVEAHKRIADAYAKQRNDKQEREYLKRTVAEYDRRRLGPDKFTASKAASDARMRLLEDEFAAWDKLKISGRGKELEKSFKNKLQQAKKLQDQYSDIVRFKNVEAILAAFYKKGFVLERFSNTLQESSCPPEIKRKLGEEGCILYQELLVQKVSGLEEAAVKLYENTLAECRKAKLLENEWCAKTLESLNRFRPKEYPVLKKPRGAMPDQAIFPPGLAETPEGPRVTKKESKVTGGDEK